MNVSKPTIHPPARDTLLGVADAALAQSLTREIERFAIRAHVAVASSLLQLRLLSTRGAPKVIFVDYELLESAPVGESLRQLAAAAPIILLAPLERQAEIAALVAGGDIEFVARAGNFLPMAASLIERRLRWAGMSGSMVGPPWAEFPGDMATIFRHEINNPLTGILGNAELLLAHRDHLSTVDTQRLQTVVDLAVRLRETTRRLSNAWENQPTPARSA
jgi:signal transduction histidine kinase